eukprot:2861923-Amphidinium_carterae.1
MPQMQMRFVLMAPTKLCRPSMRLQMAAILSKHPKRIADVYLLPHTSNQNGSHFATMPLGLRRSTVREVLKHLGR